MRIWEGLADMILYMPCKLKLKASTDMGLRYETSLKSNLRETKLQRSRKIKIEADEGENKQGYIPERCKEGQDCIDGSGSDSVYIIEVTGHENKCWSRIQDDVELEKFKHYASFTNETVEQWDNIDD